MDVDVSFEGVWFHELQVEEMKNNRAREKRYKVKITSVEVEKDEEGNRGK